MAASHSACVGSTSRTKPCRWRVSDPSTSRSRGSGVRAKLFTTASVAVSSVKSLANGSPGVAVRAGRGP